jgi:putative SOS response-associated peptidase YedK
MCGRFQDTRSWAEYHRHLSLASIPVSPDQGTVNLQQRPDIRPTDDVVIIKQTTYGAELTKARWWLVPFFHKGNLKDWKATTFNARAETIKTAPTYRDAFRHRRCLIGADGWWEWSGSKSDRKKWWIEPADKSPMMFAGLWDRVETTDLGPQVTCTMVTQPPGALAHIHSRAPLVLWTGDWARWLDPSENVDDLLTREPADQFALQLA